MFAMIHNLLKAIFRVAKCASVLLILSRMRNGNEYWQHGTKKKHRRNYYL